MEQTLYQQTITFLWSFAVGVIIALLYIVMEVTRELSPPNQAGLMIEDLFFTGIAAAINFFFALSQTQGYIRWYVLFAQAAAFVIVYFTLGRLLKYVTKWFVGVVKYIVGGICAPIRKITKKIAGNLSKKCRVLSKKVKKN